MKVINAIVFFYLIIIIHNEEQVINTCGKIGYDEPQNPNECQQKGEYCCYVHIEGESNGKQINKKFCVTTASNIKINDVKSDIEKYTGLTLKELVCNNSHSIKVTFYLLFLIIFI